MINVIIYLICETAVMVVPDTGIDVTICLYDG